MSTLTVGAGQSYSSISAAINAAQSGDTVQVQAGTYVNDFATIRKSITLVSVGGMAHLVATASPPDGKAIFTLGASGTTISITGFEFSGAAVGDNNGAGIRYEGGALTLTNDYFHDNQEGLLAGSDPNGTITISHTEFARNGAGDGYSHNLYVNAIAQLTIDSSYFHEASVGHEIKSRAAATTITNSRIYDLGGTGSYSIDLPNGGVARIQGNVIEQGPASQNPMIIAYGEEGNVPGNSSLTVSGNTILNDLGSGSARAVWNASSAAATISGNAFYGLSADQVLRGSGR